jgi:hypothetical protein
MPRWATRIILEITAVRVEFLQKISRSDAIAEGATKREKIYGYQKQCPGWSLDWSRVGALSRFAGGIHSPNCKQPLSESDICLDSPRMAFANHWNKLITKPGLDWDSNPWVWVISFRRIDHEG